MFPPPPNPVISIEHGCRDSRLSTVPHTEDAEEKGRRVVLGCQNWTCTAPTTTTPPVPQNLKTVLLKQQTQAVNDRIPAKGCRHSPGQALGKWHGKGKYVSAVRGHHQRQGKDHWNQQVGPEETGDPRGEASFQPDPDGGGTHRAGSGAGRGRRSQEVAGRRPMLEVQTAQTKVTEAAFRVGQAMEEMARIKNLLGREEGNSEPAGQ